MSHSRTGQILDEWRAMADAATIPAKAPKPSRSAYPFGIAGTAVAVVVLIIALSARVHNASPGGPGHGGFGSGPSITPSATVPAATPRSTEVASPSQVPSTGGPCSASQFVLGKATSAYGYGALGTTSVYVTQRIRNGGGSCVLQLPGTISVASATGSFQTVRVVNAGTASSFSVQSDQSFSIVLGAWWWIGGHTENGTPLPAPPCTDRISDVSRVKFPIASGSIQIDLGTVWQEVCSSPASVSLTITNQGRPRPCADPRRLGHPDELDE